jgi:hypothetical protein
MESKDPVVLLSRFTPTERDTLRMLLRPEDRRELLLMKWHHRFQRFPSDFLGSKASKYGSIASEKEWLVFWNLLEKDVKHDMRLSSGEVLMGQRRQIFPHLPKLQLMGSDVLPPAKINN